MDEIDIIYDYKHLYGYDWYSFRDAAMESEHIVSKKIIWRQRSKCCNNLR